MRLGLSAEGVSAAARSAVHASGRRWISTGPARTVLQPGRWESHVLDVVLTEGPLGGGLVVSRVLVLARRHPARRPEPGMRAPTDALSVPGLPATDTAARARGLEDARGRLPDGTLWWLLPHDPRLPGLGAAADADHLREWLGGLGVPGTPEWIAYLPGTRAVLRTSVRAPGGAVRPLYLKVLPPARIHSLHHRLRLAGAAGVPVPPLVAPPELGVLPLDLVPGRSWRRRLAEGAGCALAPAAVQEMLDALPAGLVAPDPAAADSAAPLAPDGGAAAWEERLAHAEWAHGMLDPAAVVEVGRLGERLRRGLEDGGAGPVVPVHGDLHPGNVHVDAAGTAITGLLDADTLGAGHRVDDWAVLVAHLRAAAADRAADGGPGVAPEALADLARRHTAHAMIAVDATALAARSGIALLELAAEPAAPPAIRSARRAAARAHAVEAGLSG